MERMIEEKFVSEFAREFNFDDIRPYNNNEVRAKLMGAIEDPMFTQLCKNLWPQMKAEHIKEKAERVNSSLEFQLEFMNAAIHTIIAGTSTGLSNSGFEKLDPAGSYLYIANHRDILLDAAILQIVLVANGFPTSEICFGDNLSQQGFINTFGKLNRMFTVQREGSTKELYEVSRKLSAYIRHTILDKGTSVWIAQRNGRTKDGLDQTQSGLLKMLRTSGGKSFVENFSQLKIVPLTISYEYEPCDFMKTQELYTRQVSGTYTKTKGEDMQSLVAGIKQQKGLIHLAAGTPVSLEQLQTLDQLQTENDKVKALAATLDSEINSNYVFRPVNYIAADLLEGEEKRNGHYTSAEKENFIKYMSTGLSQLQGEKDSLAKIFLGIYASPLNYQEKKG